MPEATQSLRKIVPKVLRLLEPFLIFGAKRLIKISHIIIIAKRSLWEAQQQCCGARIGNISIVILLWCISQSSTGDDATMQLFAVLSLLVCYNIFYWTVDAANILCGIKILTIWVFWKHPHVSYPAMTEIHDYFDCGQEMSHYTTSQIGWNYWSCQMPGHNSWGAACCFHLGAVAIVIKGHENTYTSCMCCLPMFANFSARNP